MILAGFALAGPEAAIHGRTFQQKHGFDGS
jgi:hypothetical protein